MPFFATGNRKQEVAGGKKRKVGQVFVLFEI